MCKIDTAIQATNATAAGCGGLALFGDLLDFLPETAKHFGAIGLLLSVFVNFYFQNKRLKMEKIKNEQDYLLKKQIIENKRADNLDLMEEYYKRETVDLKEKLNKIDNLEEFIKDIINKEFQKVK